MTEGGPTDLSGNPITHRTFIDPFEQAQSSVKVEFAGVADFAAYRDGLRLRLSAPDGPDIFVAPGDAPAWADLAADLTPLAEAKWGAGWRDRLLPATHPGVIVDGKLVGIPWTSTFYGVMAANDAIMADNQQRIPGTYDELKSTIESLRATGVEAWVLGTDAEQPALFLNLVAEEIAPGSFGKALSGEIPFTDPSLVEALSVIQRFADDGLFQVGVEGTPEYGPAGAWTKFSAGETALHLGLNWQTILNTTPFAETIPSWPGVSLFPLPDFSGDGAPTSYILGAGHVYMINAQSEKKEQAFEFIEYMFNDGIGVYVNLGTQLPGARDAQVEPPRELWMSDAGESIYQDLTSNLEDLKPMYYSPPHITDALRVAVQEVLAGTKTPAEALGEVEAAR